MQKHFYSHNLDPLTLKSLFSLTLTTLTTTLTLHINPPTLMTLTNDPNPKPQATNKETDTKLETTKKAKPWIQTPNHKHATKMLQKSPRRRPQALQLGPRSSRHIPKPKCNPQTLQKSPQTPDTGCRSLQAGPSHTRMQTPTVHKQLPTHPPHELDPPPPPPRCMPQAPGLSPSPHTPDSGPKGVQPAPNCPPQREAPKPARGP